MTTNTNTNYLELEKIFHEVSCLNNLLKISQWDFATQLPQGSAPSRQKEMATLAATIHKIKSSIKVKDLITNALEEQLYLDEWQLVKEV